MSYAKQIVELVTLENLGECPLLRHGQAVDIALKADTEIAALRARIRELTEFRTMETAPKGRRAILVHCAERKNTYAVYWNLTSETWFVFGGFNALSEEPTGWLPLPGSGAP